MVGPGRVRGVIGALGWVAVGSMVANIAAYLVYVGAGRWLLPGDYGQFARLLSAMLILGVPALALQAVIAREVVRGRAGNLRRVSITTTLGVLVTAAIAVPIVAAVADTGIPATVAALAAAPLLVIIAAGQGVLQGRQEFRALAWVLAVVGALRSVPMLVAFAVGAGPAGGLAAGTLGAVVAAGIVGVAVRATGTGPLHPGRVGRDGDADGDGARDRVSALSVLRASQVQLVLIVAVSIDLLLSRTALDEVDAGIYGLGAVATKAAFWLPQAIGVVLYPRLADPARSRTSLRQAVAVVAGIGVLVTVGAGVAAPLVPIVIGEEYRPLVGILWLFAYTGAAMAVLQVVLLAAIAADRTRVAVGTWVAVVIEAVVTVTVVHSIVTLALTAAITVTVAAVGTGVYCLRVMSPTPAPPSEPETSDV
ncbi:polysaccharide biosynthesis protein [Gordonia sp. NB41Y]|uniref:polysaccharide biosynthesis protein n=1 Tax=Gordonia sp. NB41Y TaxID=875808 RepID=UPI00273C8B26|nr:polysaccharide biosynthesis protein [Gordonia sp. NB41Y]WLP88932.1 polysaccharide biosynthesis protein [Gordonia sp. NB41Y]